MPSIPRTFVIGARVTPSAKSGFAALAARQGLSESALLGHVIDRLVTESSAATPSISQPGVALPKRRSDGRIALRLRPGDRELAQARAEARHMKTASYLTMLIRTHVRGAPVMPPTEIEELKVLAGRLAAIHRLLWERSREESGTANDAAGEPPTLVIAELCALMDSVREAIGTVVRANLIRWEAGNA